MNPNAQNRTLILETLPPEEYAIGSRQKRKREKSDWTLAIERLNAVFTPKTFSFSVLSFSECKKLSEIMLNEDAIYTDNQKVEARDLFINSNLKLVRQISLGYMKKYSQTPIEDLFQMGVIGLIRAVEKWEPDREFLFSTYATWWIRQSITRSAMDEESFIRIPIHMQERVNKFLAYQEQYLNFFNFLPDDQEASDALEIGLKEFLTIKSAVYSFERIQDYSRRDGELTVFATLPNTFDESCTDPFVLVERSFLEEQLDAVLAGITSREERIIRLRYGLVDGIPKTLDEIGKDIGVTRERVRQIESKVMGKLRHPSRSLSLKDYLDPEEYSFDIQPENDLPSCFRVGAEPLT
jgi:RNA polymerase primary sigma factor